MRVALLEARMSGELASLISRNSGVPYCVPAVREEAREATADVAEAIAWLREAPRVVVLSTGVGVDELYRQADALGFASELQSGLALATTVCRGPKPVAALKKRGLTATVRVESPYTGHELLAALGELDLDGREALVIHYGERSAQVVDALTERGVSVRDLLLYEWQLPEDLLPLMRLVDEIIERRVGAVAFTSQVQARHLMQVADTMRRRDELLEALATHTLVVAIGPTCADALRALGVVPNVVPQQPKMGPMVAALAQLLHERSPSSRPMLELAKVVPSSRAQTG
jgi:uroporphyrinogen-III synthase